MACTTMKFGKKFFEDVQTTEPVSDKNVEKKPQSKNIEIIEVNDDCSELCAEFCNIQ